MLFKAGSNPCLRAPIQLIGLLQLTITWYKIRHAGGQAHYYSPTGTLKQRDLNQSSLTCLCFNVPVIVSCKRPILPNSLTLALKWIFRLSILSRFFFGVKRIHYFIYAKNVHISNLIMHLSMLRSGMGLGF